MCVVSAMGDHYSNKFRQPDYQNLLSNIQGISRAEFEALKREVEEMKAILKKAVEYDVKNNEPHCEVEDKVKLLKQVAELLGVDLKDVFHE